MGSSGDEDFGWTNTSNDDSEPVPEMTYDGESESGKIYKKKLQKELFQNGEPESEETRESQQTPRKKSKKPKREKSSPSPSPRRVKRESLANGHDDAAAAEHMLKVKIKQERASLPARAPQHSPRKRRASAAGLEPEPEPELEVKSEQPHKKKKKRDKKRGTAENETNDSCATAAVDDLVNGSTEGPADHASSHLAVGPSESCTDSPQKKKKKKRKSEGIEESDTPKDESYYESWWKCEAEETVVQSRPQPKPKPLSKKRLAELANPLPSKEFVSDDSSSEDERARAGLGDARPADSPRRASLPERITFEDTQSECGVKNVRKESQAPTESTRRARISERITFEEDSQSASERSAPTLLQRKSPPEPARPRISERITFEESGSEPERRAPEPERRAPEPERRAPAPAPRAARGRLGRFLRAHAHMHPVLGDFPPGAAVTADDDVWLLHCPRDLPASALRGLTLDLDFRSKLKAGGQAYEATPLPAAGERVAVLAPAAGRGFCVRSVPVRGALRLRARLPRPRAVPAPDEAEPERVPLPAARRRHPLLGADYERALQAALPPGVRRRLAAASARVPLPRRTDRVDDDVGDRREKKKKKKKHKERAEPEPEPELEPSLEREPEQKKRKRKHSSRREPSPPPPPPSPPPPRKKKRRDDAAVWDSEQAIEESLFNF